MGIIKPLNSWKEVKGPIDMRDEEGRELISVLPHNTDPGQTTVAIPSTINVIVTTESMERIFPGQELLVNRDDIFYIDLTTGQVRVIIHSEEPI